MSDLHEALKKKFAPPSAGTVVQLPSITTPTPSGKRTNDRERMPFRLNRELVRDLRALKLALGIGINEMVEEMIVNGVAKKVSEVKTSKPGEWDVIRRCANK